MTKTFTNEKAPVYCELFLYLSAYEYKEPNPVKTLTILHDTAYNNQI